MLFWLYWKQWAESESPTQTRKKTARSASSLASRTQQKSPAPAAETPEALADISHDKYHWLTQGSDQSLCILSPTQGASYFSPNWAKLTGFSLDECSGKKFWNLLQPDHRSKLKEKLKAVSIPAGDDKIQMKCQIKHADNTWQWYELRLASARNNPQNIPEFICVLKNISNEVLAQKSSQKAKLDAELALKGRSEFLANMSHELRTPLNAILGFSQMMQNQVYGEINNTKYLDYLASIEASGQTLLEKINDLIEISRIDTGRVTMNEEIVDLADVIHQAVEIHSHEAFSSQIRVDQELPASPLWLRADRVKLKHLVSNLLSNAFRHTHTGGLVHIGCQRLEDGALTITVSDTGMGIPPRQLKAITEALTQDDSFFARDINGLGMGLALAKEYATLHQGDLTIGSTMGKGTSVVITLPKDRVVEFSETHEFDTLEPLDYISFLSQAAYN